MQLQELAQTSAALAGTRSRLRKTALLADCLADRTPADVRLATAYLSGVLPQGRIGIGPAALRKVRPEPASQPALSLRDVDAALQAIAGQSGAGSQARRAATLAALLGQATAGEQDFLLRLLLGELRQGALDGIAAEGIAHAAGVEPRLVRRAIMLSGDLAGVAATAISDGEHGLAAYRLELFRPLQPMLAQPAADLDAALPAGQDVALEYKLDGARVQIHRDGDTVRVYTRQLNDVTASVPDLVERVRGLPGRRCVLDGEAIAFDSAGRPLPFQVTMQRFGRRRDVTARRQRLPLSLRVFDCLMVDDATWIDRPYVDRMQRLDALVPPELRVPRLVTADAASASAFLRGAIAAGHEGVMVKTLDSLYQAGSRGADWRKLKPSHTLDLVVLAAEWGSGRRRGLLSNLHLGARDTASGDFVMLGKTFKGLTDAMLRWQTEQLLAREIARTNDRVQVRPELVVEVAFNELQRSRQYPAGLALRFARVKRYREDKGAADADTLDTVRRIHAAGLQGLV